MRFVLCHSGTRGKTEVSQVACTWTPRQASRKVGVARARPLESPWPLKLILQSRLGATDVVAMGLQEAKRD